MQTVIELFPGDFRRHEAQLHICNLVLWIKPGTFRHLASHILSQVGKSGTRQRTDHECRLEGKFRVERRRYSEQILALNEIHLVDGDDGASFRRLQTIDNRGKAAVRDTPSID